jgi:hypothetical protein
MYLHNIKNQALANGTNKDYASSVPEKKGNEFSSSNHTKAHRPRHAVFLRAYVIASFLWAAMAGRLRPAGSFGVRSANPVICCPPRLAAGGSVTTHQRGQS